MKMVKSPLINYFFFSLFVLSVWHLQDCFVYRKHLLQSIDYTLSAEYRALDRMFHQRDIMALKLWVQKIETVHPIKLKIHLHSPDKHNFSVFINDNVNSKNRFLISRITKPLYLNGFLWGELEIYLDYVNWHQWVWRENKSIYLGSLLLVLIPFAFFHFRFYRDLDNLKKYLQSIDQLLTSQEPIKDEESCCFKNGHYLGQLVSVISPFIEKWQSSFQSVYKNKLLEDWLLEMRRVAHDMRTPLEFIISNQSDSENLKEVACELRELSDQLISSANISTGTLFTLNREKKFLRSLIKNWWKRIENFYYQQDQLNLSLFISPSVKSIVVDWNSEEWEAVMANILQNGLRALQFTGKISLIVRRHFHWIEMIFVDNGPGIDTTQSSKGHGVGLNYVQQAMKRWGGKVEISSHKGRGTTVTLQFPTKWCLPDLGIIKEGKGEIQAVYIDDNDLARYIWECSAQQNGLSLLTLDNPEKLVEHMKKIGQETIIYLDHLFPDYSYTGLLWSQYLHSLGIQNLFLVSCYPFLKNEIPPYLTLYTKKSPPWEIDIVKKEIVVKEVLF